MSRHAYETRSVSVTAPTYKQVSFRNPVLFQHLLR